jgi:hypothetical protein
MKSITTAALLALALASSPAGAAAICKGGPACDKPPLQRACQDPESGIEFPKGYQCVGEDKIGWQCEIGTGPGRTEKFYIAGATMPVTTRADDGTERSRHQPVWSSDQPDW